MSASFGGTHHRDDTPTDPPLAAKPDLSMFVPALIPHRTHSRPSAARAGVSQRQAHAAVGTNRQAVRVCNAAASIGAAVG